MANSLTVVMRIYITWMIDDGTRRHNMTTPGNFGRTPATLYSIFRNQLYLHTLTTYSNSQTINPTCASPDWIWSIVSVLQYNWDRDFYESGALYELAPTYVKWGQAQLL